MNEVPAWKYAVGLVGVIAAGALAVCNVLSAYNALTGEPIKQFAASVVMLTVIDIGVIALLIGMKWLHQHRHPAIVAMFGAFWLALSVVSIVFAGRYVDYIFSTAQAPAEAKHATLAEAHDKWQTRWNTESEHLKASELQALTAAKKSVRDDAKEEAQAARARLTAIEAEEAAKPAVVLNAPMKHDIHGYGIYAAALAWLVSQMVWIGISASPIRVRTGEEFPTPSPEDKVRTSPPVLTQSSPTEDKVRTGEDQVRTSAKSKASVRTKVGTEVRTDNVVPMVRPQQKPTGEDIENMVRAGFSQRAIAKHFGVDPKTVKKVRSESKTDGDEAVKQ